MQVVPISIIKHSLEAKVLTQLKLYLYLKSLCSGTIIITDEVEKQICEALDIIEKRTINTNLQWLLTHRWIAKNSKTQVIRINSFERLHKRLKSCVPYGARMETKDFKNFRPFIYASFITWVLTTKSKSDEKPERKIGRTAKGLPYSLFKELPNRYLSEVVSLDQCTYSRYKKGASDAGYISVHHQFEDLKKDPKELPLIRKYSDEDTANSLTIRKGTVQIRKSDLIKSYVSICYLKRLNRLQPNK